MTLKDDVRDFWNQASCGESLYLSSNDKEGYRAQAKARYGLEGWMIFLFAQFHASSGQSVLEIGVGLGADHQQSAQAGAKLTGIDLTARAVEHTRCRLQACGLSSDLSTGDTENLPFADECFDVVYSWGVLHHSPDTSKAVKEVFRVLRWGGGSNHDLPQVGHGRLDAMDPLWLDVFSSIPEPGGNLREAFGEPRNQGVFP